MKQTALTFPFPFQNDVFSYTNNVKLLEPPLCIQVTPEYKEEMTLKRRLLTEHPERCFVAQPEMMEAQWEVLDLLAHQLAAYYPTHFSLEKQGDWWTFTNHMIKEETAFCFGDASTLPCDPLDFIGRQVQEDLIVMAQREDDLFLDAGQLCFPGNWSLSHTQRLPFLQIHAPVPGVNDSGLGDRILRFLLRVKEGKPCTRLNWSLNAGYRLDTTPETFDEWGPMRQQITRDNVAQDAYLRVEDQNLFRLPKSGHLLFSIHTYLLAIEELVKNPLWTKQLHGVLSTVPEDVAQYKGIAAYYKTVLAYLDEVLKQDVEE